MQFSSADGAIALAVYEPHPELITVQLRTIARQSLATWRCHIGIDGRDDAAHQLVLSLTGDDERFVVHHYEDNVGIYRNFERLTREIHKDTPWFALSDQDDAWDADKLERMVAVLAGEDEVTAVVGQARVVDRAGTYLSATKRREVPLQALLLDNQVTGSLAVFRRDLLDVALPFPPPTPAAYHDHWLGVVAAGTGRIRFLDDEVQDYVQHGANALGEEGRRGLVARLRALADGSRRPRTMLDRLAVERWGWRQTMATTLAARLGAGAALPALSAFATPSPARVLGAVAHSVACRQVGAQRALAIWVGSVWARVARPCAGATAEVVGS